MLTKYIKKSKLVALLNAFNIDEIPLDSMNLANLLEPLLPQTHKQNIACLVDAVKAGDVHNPIFHDEKAEFYLVYLYVTHQFLTDQIEPEHEVDLAGFINTLKNTEHRHDIASLNKEEFIQSYIYLMGKKDYPDDLCVITAGNKTDAASSTLRTYAKTLHANYPNVTEKVILDRISTLSGINKTFMLVPKKPQTDALLTEALIHPAGSLEQTTTPATELSYNGNAWILIPPIELVIWLAKQCNPSHQITMEPCLGIIGTDTLYRDFHQKNKRPVTLASTHVANNLTTAHELSSTALSIPAHDIYFHFMALALFPHNGFRFITEVILPELRKMERYEENTPTKEQQHNIQRLIEFINDFAMESDTKIINEITPEIQIAQYLNAAMDQDDSSFFIFLQLIPIINSRIIELDNTYDLDCASLISLIYLIDEHELANIIPQLNACGLAHAFNTYNAYTRLKENDLHTSAISELIVQNKEYSVQLADSLITLNTNGIELNEHTIQIIKQIIAIDRLRGSKSLGPLDLTNQTMCITKFIELDPHLLSTKAIEYLCSLPQSKNVDTQPIRFIYGACKKLNDLIKTANQTAPNSLFSGEKIPQASITLIKQLITSLCEGRSIELERLQQLQKISEISTIIEAIMKHIPQTIEYPSSTITHLS